MIYAAIAHGSNCFTFRYITLTQAAQLDNLATADRMISTFQLA